MSGPGLSKRRAWAFATPAPQELAERCLTQSDEPGRRAPEGCCEVFVGLLFSDFTPVAIILLVYATLYAVYHFNRQ